MRMPGNTLQPKPTSFLSSTAKKHPGQEAGPQSLGISQQMARLPTSSDAGSRFRCQ
jgi:hypothetical protein